MLKTGAVARQPYYIEFALLIGSSVDKVDLYFDGVLDAGTTWNDATMQGLSSFHPQGDLYPGIHTISITISNTVSTVIVLFSFELYVKIFL